VYVRCRSKDGPRQSGVDVLHRDFHAGSTPPLAPRMVPDTWDFTLLREGRSALRAEQRNYGETHAKRSLHHYLHKPENEGHDKPRPGATRTVTSPQVRTMLQHYRNTTRAVDRRHNRLSHGRLAKRSCNLTNTWVRGYDVASPWRAPPSRARSPAPPGSPPTAGEWPARRCTIAGSDAGAGAPPAPPAVVASATLSRRRGRRGCPRGGDELAARPPLHGGVQAIVSQAASVTPAGRGRSVPHRARARRAGERPAWVTGADRRPAWTCLRAGGRGGMAETASQRCRSRRPVPGSSRPGPTTRRRPAAGTTWAARRW
jgi:hypothetical protein